MKRRDKFEWGPDDFTLGAKRAIGDDRAGPAVTDDARTESERALAENIENAFAAARERLIRRVGG